jgi:penicillin amidase
MYHLQSPTTEQTGAAIPGVPGIMIGQNNDIAWGITNVGSDVEDLFVMNEITPDVSYLYKGKTIDYQISQEKIFVKDHENVVINVKNSVYGPIVNDIFGISSSHPMAFNWISLQANDTTFESFFSLSKSKNWEEFRSAASLMVSPSCNIIYADQDGNIGYQMTGKTPIRKEGHSGLFPVAGTGE